MIIGLCGPEGAGKSTAAKILRRELGLPIKPFAGPLKRMLVALGVPKPNIYGTPAQKEEPLDMLGGLSARKAMQLLGTEWGRNLIAPDVWSRAWEASVNVSHGAIADDLRFLNEAESVYRLGGVVICIVRDMGDFKRATKHASERFMDVPRDIVIVNNGSRAALRMNLMNELLDRKLAA